MGRRLVISDIHGCARTLEALLHQLAPTQQDTLYFLGDYIDRGPSSAAVLDTLLRLEAEGQPMVWLRGNHEENFMKAFHEWVDSPGMFQRFVQRINKSGDLLDENGLPIARYWKLMERTQYYHSLPDAILVHAGLRFDLDDPFADPVALVELRRMDYQGQKVAHRPILHGHVPTTMVAIEDAVARRGPVVPLDNGCVYYHRQKRLDGSPGDYGHLLALDLDTWQLYKQLYQE